MTSKAWGDSINSSFMDDINADADSNLIAQMIASFDVVNYFPIHGIEIHFSLSKEQ